MNSLKIGDVLVGFCNGIFGRDSYEEKIVEAIGRDWVVVRDSENNVLLAQCQSDELLPFIQ